jgi:HEAT repeat protein
METQVILTNDQFDKLIKEFAFRYIIDYSRYNCGEYQCTVFVEPFVQLISHKSKTIRKVSIIILGESRHQDAVRLLINALDDESPSVKKLAVYFLGKLDDRTALRPLLFAANEKKATYANAILAIRSLLGWDLESEMVRALSDSDSKIRTGAASVLLNFLSVPESTSALICALNSKKFTLRILAIKTLGNGDSISACEALIESFKTHPYATPELEFKERINAIENLKTKMDNALQGIAEFLKANPSMQQIP